MSGALSIPNFRMWVLPVATGFTAIFILERLYVFGAWSFNLGKERVDEYRTKEVRSRKHADLLAKLAELSSEEKDTLQLFIERSVNCLTLREDGATVILRQKGIIYRLQSFSREEGFRTFCMTDTVYHYLLTNPDYFND